MHCFLHRLHRFFIAIELVLDTVSQSYIILKYITARLCTFLESSYENITVKEKVPPPYLCFFPAVNLEYYPHLVAFLYVTVLRLNKSKANIVISKISSA